MSFEDAKSHYGLEYMEAEGAGWWQAQVMIRGASMILVIDPAADGSLASIGLDTRSEPTGNDTEREVLRSLQEKTEDAWGRPISSPADTQEGACRFSKKTFEAAGATIGMASSACEFDFARSQRVTYTLTDALTFDHACGLAQDYLRREWNMMQGSGGRNSIRVGWCRDLVMSGDGASATIKIDWIDVDPEGQNERSNTITLEKQGGKWKEREGALQLY